MDACTNKAPIKNSGGDFSGYFVGTLRKYKLFRSSEVYTLMFKAYYQL